MQWDAGGAGFPKSPVLCIPEQAWTRWSWGAGLSLLLGARGLISVAHWQPGRCTGHAGISSQLFYITKICLLGKFQGTAAINLHSLPAKANDGPLGLFSLLTGRGAQLCTEAASGGPLPRRTLPWHRPRDGRVHSRAPPFKPQSQSNPDSSAG